MQPNQKVEIDRRPQASKFLKDLDELRVFDNRLVSLRRIPTTFFLPPPPRVSLVEAVQTK